MGIICDRCRHREVLEWVWTDSRTGEVFDRTIEDACSVGLAPPEGDEVCGLYEYTEEPPWT